MNNEVRLIDANALRKDFLNNREVGQTTYSISEAIEKIDNASTVEEIEKLFITECRNTAIKENLPLYFVYYEETGAFEVYVTKTKELFEKRHCIKHLSDYEFEKLAMQYLDDYSDWKVGEDAKND